MENRVRLGIDWYGEDKENSARSSQETFDGSSKQEYIATYKNKNL